jgi:hypothetical protein
MQDYCAQLQVGIILTPHNQIHKESNILFNESFFSSDGESKFSKNSFNLGGALHQNMVLVVSFNIKNLVIDEQRMQSN